MLIPFGPGRRSVSVVLFVIVMLCCAGCVHEKIDQDGNHVFQYELWVSLSAIVGGIIAFAAGFPLLRYIRKLGVACILTGVIAVIMIGPSMYRDKAVIGENHFSLRTGLWGITSKHEIDYADLSLVRFTVERRVDSDGDVDVRYSLLCERTDGTAHQIPLGSEVAKSAAPVFVERLKASGIPVVDETVVGPTTQAPAKPDPRPIRSIIPSPSV